MAVQSVSGVDVSVAAMDVRSVPEREQSLLVQEQQPQHTPAPEEKGKNFDSYA